MIMSSGVSDTRTSVGALLIVAGAILAASSGAGSAVAQTAARGGAEACREVLGVGNLIPMQDGKKVPIVVTSATMQPAMGATPTSRAQPEHCEVFAKINERVSSVDGQTYAIKFHLRMPVAGKWNRRFFFQGGGGNNGNIGTAIGSLSSAADLPDSPFAQGFAVVTTDSGHDASNTVQSRGRDTAFGMDPQARSDYAYNAYDVVTQASKTIISKFYGDAPSKSYFGGCSEGGREGVVMASRFPHHFDGIISGAAALDQLQSSIGVAATMQYLADEARAQKLVSPNGTPAVHKLFTDADIQLIADAVTRACDADDGLADGMVSKPLSCTSAKVHPQLDVAACSGAKTAACLSATQIRIVKHIFEGPRNSYGEELYHPWTWDAGIGGVNASTGVLNQSWRNWYFGSYNQDTSNAIRLSLNTQQLLVVFETPPIPYDFSESAQRILSYNWMTKSPIASVNFRASGPYEAQGDVQTTNHRTDLTAFKQRGGKLMLWHGTGDPAVPMALTKRWFYAMSARTGVADTFSQYYPVPGLGHCRGGPATDQFDMLTPLVNWVENGVAPASVLATASTPAYFGANSRSRPLCPLPKAAIYKGSGDINSSDSFACR